MEYKPHTVNLAQPIDLNLLKSGTGTEFEVDCNEFAGGGRDAGGFDEFYFGGGALPGDDEEEQGSCGSIEITSFEHMSAHMENVTDDGLVKKNIIKQGSGAKVLESGKEMTVTIHYNLYREFSGEPCDSSTLRNEPQKFKLWGDYVVPGLHYAVNTMRKGERAHFLIGPKYILGDQGCPPRIPGGVNMLYDVELLSAVAVTGVDAFYQLSNEEKRESDLEVVETVAEWQRQEGKSHFQRNNFGKALRCYDEGIRVLDECRVKDEAEDDRRETLKRQLLTNAVVCHTKLNQHGRVITRCHEILDIDPQHAKAMYFLGKAYRHSSEWQTARQWLLKAQSRIPDNKAVRMELKELDVHLKQHSAQEKDFCQRMFGLNSPGQTQDRSAQSRAQPNPEISTRFLDMITDVLQDFIDNNPNQSMPVPSMPLADVEKTAFINKAENMGLTVEYRGEGHNEHIRIVKKLP